MKRCPQLSVSSPSSDHKRHTECCPKRASSLRMKTTVTRLAGSFSRLTKWVVVGFTVVLTGGLVFLAYFYVEENWRGKRAWEQCKRELSVGGPVLEWTSYVP